MNFFKPGRDNFVNIVFVGDDVVGKNDIIQSYVKSHSSVDYVPTYYDRYPFDVEFNNTQTGLMLSDTRGLRDYSALRPLYYNHASVFVVVFSIVEPNSFNNVLDYYRYDLSRCEDAKPIILVGSDLDKRSDPSVIKKLSDIRLTPVTYLEGIRSAQELGACSYIECSAVDNTNINMLFDQAIKCGLSSEYTEKMQRQTCLNMRNNKKQNYIQRFVNQCKKSR